MNSREKGKRGEREAAEWLRTHGIEARRGVQYCGGADSGDLVCDLPGFHLEVKRTETLRHYDALDQATGDAGGKVPVVLHKKNRRRWIVILDGQDFLRLATGAAAHVHSASTFAPDEQATGVNIDEDQPQVAEALLEAVTGRKPSWKRAQ